MLANGNPDDLIQVFHEDVTYEEPLILLYGNGKTFENVRANSGPIIQQSFYPRSCRR